MGQTPDQIEQTAKVISHSQIFNGINEVALQALASAGSIADVPSGSFLVEEGGKVAGLYVLLEGAAEVQKSGKTFTVFGRGSFFGEISLFGVSFGATASVKAKEKAKFLLVTKEVLDSWSKKFPDAERIFLRKMCVELCRRVYSTSDRLK